MSLMKKTLAVLTALLCLSAAACKRTDIPELESSGAAAESGSGTDENGVQLLSETKTADEGVSLSKFDLDTEWSETDPSIVFSGTAVTPSVSDGIHVENGTVTITSGGKYVLSGKLDDGRIVVDLNDSSDKVHLIFNGVSVHSEKDAPLSILKADKAVITLAENTENQLSDTAQTESDGDTKQTMNACIGAKCDLTVNGTGSLTVSGNAKNGIHCKDDLKIVSGTVQVEAVNHGIRGNESVLIHSGIVSVKAGGDGIRSTDTDKEGKGWITVQGGDVTVVSAQDGIDAATNLTVSGGNLEIESGGGTANAAPHRNEGRGFGFKPQTDSAEATQTAEDTPSQKGLKAAGALTLTGGKITVNAADDAVHTDTDAAVSGKTVLTVRSGDDGIHADSKLSIDGEAAVTVSESYEGLEARELLIAGGETRVTASDDGLNAAGMLDSANETGETAEKQPSFGGRGGFGMMNANSTGTLTVSGGYLFVNANGDGLDSNGDIVMTGGTVAVCGPTSDGNGPLDCGDRQNTIKVTGGTLMAVGSTGMMDVPEENYIAASDLNAAADTLITVTDAEGKVLGALKTPKKAAGIVFSANGMNDGYSIYSGGSYDGTLNEDGFGTGGSCSGGTLVKSGSGGEGFGGFGGGGRPGFPGGDKPDFPNGEMPDFPNGEMPDFPNGEMPDFPNGEMPDFPNGEKPQFPNGEKPEGGSGRRGGGGGRGASGETGSDQLS